MPITRAVRASLVVLLACPIAGTLLLHRFPLLFTVFKRKPDPRADLGLLLIWPGIGVAFSYQNSNDPTHLVDSFQLILGACCSVGFSRGPFTIGLEEPFSLGGALLSHHHWRYVQYGVRKFSEYIPGSFGTQSL